MSDTSQICPICGGKKTKGKTTFSADLGSGVVVVREVEATICSQCSQTGLFVLIDHRSLFLRASYPGTPSCHAEAFAQVEAKNRRGGFSSERVSVSV